MYFFFVKSIYLLQQHQGTMCSYCELLFGKAPKITRKNTYICPTKIFSKTNFVCKTYNVSESFFKCPSGQIHWSDGKQWQCVNSDHDDNEQRIKDNFEKSYYKFCIEHEHCFIFPWIFTEKKFLVHFIMKEHSNHFFDSYHFGG